jgi:hypothetical protein
VTRAVRQARRREKRHFEAQKRILWQNPEMITKNKTNKLVLPEMITKNICTASRKMESGNPPVFAISLVRDRGVTTGAPIARSLRTSPEIDCEPKSRGLAGSNDLA